MTEPGRHRRARSRAPLGLLASALLVATACGGTGPARPSEVLVFAAASLTDALDELGAALERAGTVEVRHSFAASAVLSRQIERGAPADVFVSASPAWVDALERGGDVEPGTRRDLLENELVLVARDDRTGARGLPDLPDALGEGRLALADPEAAPAGIYARRALESLGLWERLHGRLAAASDVRAALALVERGECPLGLVYRSDAAGSGVTVIAPVPPDLTGRVVYTVAVVRGRLRPPVRAYLEALSGATAREIFERHGFRALGPDEGGFP